jgi:NADPH-dependent 2,4-dienoyl-CoA reductase/sulfur reductase-like enzyme/bacterioferritin-associated ferredoxin
MTDVTVIGAGPAGLAAAASARRFGATVTLVDASDRLGGQYWRQRAGEKSPAHASSRFEALRSTLETDAGCRILTGATVWAIEVAEGERSVVQLLVGEPDGRSRRRITLTPDALVIATGAYDRALPFAGWDLPGVYTAGAAQALAKGDGVAIGRRVAVAGSGPFLFPVAESLLSAGSTVVGVFEASTTRTLIRHWLARPWQLLRSPAKAIELGRYTLALVRHRVPYSAGSVVLSANGTDRVESVTIAKADTDWTAIAGTERTIAVDALCVGHGFSPRLEIAVAAGCDLVTGFVEVDVDQRSSVPGVYAAGEITGIGGVELALAEGQVAGALAAGASPTDPSLRRVLRRREVARSFARRLGTAHGIRPGWLAALTPETVVCRCEETTNGQLREAFEATGQSSYRSLQHSTRVGLGICQGRVCGRSAEEIVASWRTGTAASGPAEPGGSGTNFSSDRRPIATPIRLAELARKDTDD